MTTLTIHDESELGGIAGEILAPLTRGGAAHVLALTGDLGVGKTALTKALGRALGVTGEVTSPTFVIMKTYPIPHHPIFKSLTHIDAYRIEHEDEMRVLGFEELLADPTRLVVVEWPERISGIMPKDAHTIALAITRGSERTVTYGN